MRLSVEDLYRKYGPLVLRRCLKMLGSDAEARDAMQETFVRLLRSYDRLEIENPAGLLYRMATNVCLNQIRSSKVGGKAISYDELLVEIADGESLEVRVTSRNYLAKLFGREKESTGVIATLYYLDGMTHEEVANEVGMSVSGIRKRLRLLRESSKKMEGLTDEI